MSIVRKIVLSLLTATCIHTGVFPAITPTQTCLLALFGAPFVVQGMSFAFGGVRDTSSDMKSAPHKGDEVEAHLRDCQKYLKRGEADNSVVDSKKNCYWFHWTIKELSRSALDADITKKNIKVYTSQGYEVPLSIETFKVKNEILWQSSASVETLERIIDSCDQEIDEIQKKRKHLSLLTSMKSSLHIDKYGRCKTKTVSLDSMFKDAVVDVRAANGESDISDFYVGNLYEVNNAVREQIEQRFINNGQYSRCAIVLIRFLSLNLLSQAFKINFNKAISVYLQLVYAEMKTFCLKKFFQNELRIKRTLQAPEVALEPEGKVLHVPVVIVTPGDE